MIRHRKGLVSGCKTAIVCCAVLLHAAVVSGAVAAQEELNYSITVTSSRSVILVCEPVVLDIAVRNDAGAPVEFHEMREGVTFPLSLRVSAPDGETSSYLPLELGHMGEPPKVLLAPGEVYRYRKTLVYGVWRSAEEPKKAAYAFPEPGEYLVQAVFQHRERRFESAPLQVTVVEPAGPDREALELFRGTKQAEFIEHLTKKAPGQLGRLAMEHADTVYGRYARYYLAAMLLEHRFDWSKVRRMLGSELAGLDRAKAELRLVEKVFEKTASEFADLARSEPAFPLADQCLLYQAKCYTGSPANRKAEAVKVLKDLVAKYPESAVAVKAKKRLEKLREQAAARAKRLEQQGKEQAPPAGQPTPP